MAGNKAAIKSRIKSINSTKKITGAMELISNVKLAKSRSLMAKNKIYADALNDMVSSMLSGEISDDDNLYLQAKNAKEKLYFVFASDMGLCGGYNAEIEKLIKDIVSKDDFIIYIGNKNYMQIKEDYKIINKMTGSDTVDYEILKKYAHQALEMYLKNEINSINIIYTCFLNTISFKATNFSLLPLNNKKAKKEEYKQVDFEPNMLEILNDLIPVMIESQIYSKYLEAKTSEHGCRRFAMENATDNADELTNSLLLAYNQARQAAITQEITEIVSGADAI